MADEEKELVELTPAERARRVAGNVMDYIRDNPRQGYGGTTGLSHKDVGIAGEMLDPTVEAREFAESPGLGTGAMAAMGLTGLPAREIKKITSKLTKEHLTRLEPAIRESHLFDQILDDLNDLKVKILHRDAPGRDMVRGDRGLAGQFRGNLKANPDHPLVQRYYEVKKQLSEQGKKFRETPGFYELQGAKQNMSADDYRHAYFTDFDTP